MKKLTLNRALLAGGMILLLIMSGCASQEKKPDAAEAVKLRWWSVNEAYQYGITNYNEVEAFQKIQEKTNVSVEYIHPIIGQELEQFNIMAASGDYPDLINWRWDEQYPGGVTKAINDGIIIKLDPYLEQYAPNYFHLLEQNPEAARTIRTSDGAVPTFNCIKDDPQINSYFGPCVRKDWLDNVGLAVPATISQWHQALAAFRNGDPNGNGYQDEIPLVDEKSMLLSTFSAAWGVLRNEFYLSPAGEMVYGSIEPAFQEYLAEMRRWYDEGLIDPEFASLTRKNVDARVLSDTGGAFVGYTGSQMGTYYAEKQQSAPEFNLVGAPWPTGPAGKPYCGMAVMRQLVEHGYGTAVTTANKHIEESLRLVDFSYGEEGITLENWGSEGETFEVVDGRRRFTDKIMNNPEGLSPTQAMAKDTLTMYGGWGKVMNGEAYLPLMQRFEQQENAAELWLQGDHSLLMPSYPFTGEESERVAAILADVRPIEEEMFKKIIMGIEPVSAFDGYVTQMKELGIEEAIALNKEAYDRYLSQQ